MMSCRYKTFFQKASISIHKNKYSLFLETSQYIMELTPHYGKWFKHYYSHKITLNSLIMGEAVHQRCPFLDLLSYFLCGSKWLGIHCQNERKYVL